MNGRAYFGANDGTKGTEIWYVDNGATAIPIGDVMDGTAMAATDPVLGKNITISGTTTVTNPLNVVCLGIADSQPKSLGTFVPGSYAYFQLTNFFVIVGNIPGKAFATVLGVPNDPTLIGDSAVLQVYSLDAKNFPAKTQVSNGVHITMGK